MKVLMLEFLQDSCEKIEFIAHILLNEGVNRLRGLANLIEYVQGLKFINVEQNTNIFDQIHFNLFHLLLSLTIIGDGFDIFEDFEYKWDELMGLFTRGVLL